MKAYEDQKYEQWREHVEQVLPSLLKRNLLIKPADRAAQTDAIKVETDNADKEAGETGIWHLPSQLLWQGSEQAWYFCDFFYSIHIGCTTFYAS